MNRFYIIGNGKLLIKEKSIVFVRYENNVRKESKIPIENVDQLICIGNIGFSPNSIKNLLRKEITTILCNSNGIVKGMILPENKAFSSLYTQQVKYYLENRLEVAKSFVIGLKISAIKSLLFFRKEEYRHFSKSIDTIKIEAINIPELMGIESEIWKILYQVVRDNLPDFESREYRPPKDEVNCIISYGNSLLYSIILLKVVKHELNPRIGFLHENRNDRYSLVLDLSEIFKPFFLLLLDVALLKNSIIKEEHFNLEKDSVYLNLLGKSLYSKYFELFLKERLKIFPGRVRNIDSFIEYEIRNLKRCIIDEKIYRPWGVEYFRYTGI